jgi:hypothetical protein
MDGIPIQRQNDWREATDLSSDQVIQGSNPITSDELTCFAAVASFNRHISIPVPGLALLPIASVSGDSRKCKCWSA